MGPAQSVKQGLGVAGVIGQASCFTAFIVLVAVGLGLWLDATLGSRPWAVLALVLVSFPITLFVNYRVVQSGSARLGLTSAPKRSPSQGEGPSPNDS